MSVIQQEYLILIDGIISGSSFIYQLMTTLSKYISVLFFLALARAQPTLSTEQAWGYGFLAGFCLSLLGFLAALLLTCFQKCLSETCFKHFVGMLYALACGAIIGDAMIHIMPEAFKSQFTNTHYVSLIFICAIAFFMILERAFKACGIVHEHWGDDHDEHAEHAHQHAEIEADDKREEKKEATQPAVPKETDNKLASLSNVLILADSADVNAEIPNETSSSNIQKEKTCWENLKGKGAAGYLNLLSSFVHNFFDGFGIGVGFASRDVHIITPIVIAIVAHQIPREMGDVGVLVKNGFSNVQTVLCNGFINFMSLIGVVVGLAVGAIDDATQNYVLVFVAGNFMYIGADIWRHLLASKVWLVNIGEIIMFSIGVGAMFLVLLAESGDGGHGEHGGEQ